MSGNSFGTMFRITTWGESHGKAVGVVVDGCPAGLPIAVEDVQRDLDRRRPGQSSVSTQRHEKDRVEILSGLFEGRTTGAPISLLIWNQDADSSVYEHLRDKPRPGHADYTYQVKYGIRDHRGGGRASARETVGRVAAGAIARKFLSHMGIEIAGYVMELGGIRARSRFHDLNELKALVESNPIRCPDPEAAAQMIHLLELTQKEGDSLGGIVEIIAHGVPAGLGEPVFDKLDADLGKALMSIGAVKAIEIGAGFESARMRGSQTNDPLILVKGEVEFGSNNAGGILGGISNGAPIVCRIAVKPTPSISRNQHTVDLERGEEVEIEVKGRHDPAIPPRIVPVAESMVALVLADHILRNKATRL
ncbi:MAG: chorismate synthase [Methanotrichaceae archaeon]|nr:chorismate synthase [Methanotrichaceae archaeon]